MGATSSVGAPTVGAEAPTVSAETLMRERARSFSLAARLLPAAQRRPVTVLYAFFRTLDDLIDEPPVGWSHARLDAELDVWETWLRAGLPPDGPHPICDEVRAIVQAHGIPTTPLLAMIDGQRADLWHTQPADFAALERYCRQVAASVGETLCYVLGAPAHALPAARDLGVAMQLTNILRDVGEDLAAGRCYLPAAEMEACGCSLAMLRAGQPTPQTTALLARQAERARAYYARGRAGIWLLPAAVRPAILLAARLYERILDCVVDSGYAVFDRRAHPNRLAKALVAAGCAVELGRHALVGRA
jgi:phytoene synthase